MLKKRGLVTAGLCCCVSMLVWAQQTEASGHKVTICHKSDSVKYHQITVASRALPAHLAHGDCVVDDGVPCTVDSCNADLGCIHAPDNSLCGDGNACTNDTCDPSPVSTGCVYTPIVCDDGDVCTVDTCDPATGCQYTPSSTCGDGVVCAPEECESDADCPAGSTCCSCTCLAGPDPGCAGETCATFTSCNPTSTCTQPVCGSTTEGGGVCVEGTTPCAGLVPCSTSAECAPGVCLQATCCGIAVCVPVAVWCPEAPPPDDCFKGDVCDTAQTCTTPDGCNGACFHTAAGPTKCFFGEYFCNQFPSCDSDCDCAPGTACANSCCGTQCVPLCNTPPVDECFKGAPCAGPEVCTDPDGCNGACFFNAAGNTKCFAGEYFCGANPTCATDADCAPGFGCSDTCCGHECAPLCGGSAAAAAGASSKAPAAAAAQNRGPMLGKVVPAVVPTNAKTSSGN